MTATAFSSLSSAPAAASDRLNAALYSTDVFEFENGRLKLAGGGLDLAYPLARGRGVTPFDFDGDGRLDVFYGAGIRNDGLAPATVLLQGGDGKYAPAQEFFGSDMRGVGTLIPGRFGDDLAMDFALLGRNGVEVVTALPQGYRRGLVYRNDGTIRDFAVDDFNNDGISDIWIARGSEFDQLVSVDGQTLRFAMDAQSHDASRDEISFATHGPVTLTTATFRPGPSRILYGADSRPADAAGVTLDKRSPSTWGRPDALDASPWALGIWYAPETGMWHIEAGRQMATTLGLVRSAFPMWMASYGGLDDTPQPRDLLLLGRGDGTFARTRPVKGVSTMSVAPGDYDNDGDIDVYAVASGTAGNLANRLYLNNGTGSFSERPDPPARSASGIGDSATTVDFDADGWLDLFVANGLGPGSFLPDSEYALYRNVGGQNGWLEVKLRAEDGDPVVLGSIVTARSGSGTQMRVWDAGVRARVQDDPEVHFGVERSDFVDLVVHWRNDAGRS